MAETLGLSQRNRTSNNGEFPFGFPVKAPAKRRKKKRGHPENNSNHPVQNRARQRPPQVLSPRCAQQDTDTHTQTPATCGFDAAPTPHGPAPSANTPGTGSLGRAGARARGSEASVWVRSVAGTNEKDMPSGERFPLKNRGNNSGKQQHESSSGGFPLKPRREKWQNMFKMEVRFMLCRHQLVDDVQFGVHPDCESNFVQHGFVTHLRPKHCSGVLLGFPKNDANSCGYEILLASASIGQIMYDKRCVRPRAMDGYEKTIKIPTQMSQQYPMDWLGEQYVRATQQHVANNSS